MAWELVFHSHNDQGAEISVIWLVEQSASKLLILISYKQIRPIR